VPKRRSLLHPGAGAGAGRLPRTTSRPPVGALQATVGVSDVVPIDPCWTLTVLQDSRYLRLLLWQLTRPAPESLGARPSPHRQATRIPGCAGASQRRERMSTTSAPVMASASDDGGLVARPGAARSGRVRGRPVLRDAVGSRGAHRSREVDQGADERMALVGPPDEGGLHERAVDEGQCDDARVR
jgi:hypothetical protein